MNKSVIGDSYKDCPYNAQNCPKIEDVKTDIDKISDKLENIQRLIYVLIGVILCEFGVLII